MDFEGKKLLLCNCEGTMPLDGKALAKACGLKSALPLAHQLCRSEIGQIGAALKEGVPLLIGCTQEIAAFEEARAESDRAAPVAYVNIRETAGWSEQAGMAAPKIAGLLAMAAFDAPPVLPARTLSSHGVTLVYGRDEAALEAARQLAERLDITVMLLPGSDVMAPARMDFPVIQGRVRGARGHLGAFELVVDDYATAAPSSRRKLGFGAARMGAVSRCDIILDLTGGTPLFPAHEKRDGYFRPDPKDTVAVQRALFAAADMVGEFDKPIYVEYHADLCAHGRSKKTGCTRCLDVCPTGAIQPAGDLVAFDSAICAGCGSCSAVCPSGAAEFRLPPADHLAGRLRALLRGYAEAGGAAPILLLHDEGHGADLIDALARFGSGLPAHVLPCAVSNITQIGLDALSSAFAYGAAGIRLVARPRRDDLLPLAQNIGVMEAALAGLGYGAGRLGLIEADDPDILAAELVALKLGPGAPAAPYLPMGNKRSIAKLGLKHLHASAPGPVPRVPLPPAAPFGNVKVDTEGCTLCLACVSACPTGALADDPDRPRLTFTEDACIQCGLCKATCPEKVIALEPRLDFTPEAMMPRLVKEEEPAHCVRCGKAFGTKSTVERIVAKLGGAHWMYGENAMIDRIRMCGDCRVVVQSEQAIDPYAGPPRPVTRSTEDYIAERDAAAKEPKP